MESDPDRIAAITIGFPEAHVLSVDEDEGELWVEVETRDDVAQCPACGERVTSDKTHELTVRVCQCSGDHCIRRGSCVGGVFQRACSTGSWFEEIPEWPKGPGVSEG